MEDEELIVVRRRRRDWRTAAFRLVDIEGLHLADPDQIDYVPGDLSLSSRDAVIHGYVRYEDMVAGELDHSQGERRRRLRVCIARKDNTASAYGLLRTRIRSGMLAAD